MRDDLRRSGVGGSAEVTAFSEGMSREHDGWVADSSMAGAAGKARLSGITHRGLSDRGWTEAEMA